MEHTQIVSNTEWEQTDNKKCTLSSIASDAWKQFKLMENGWYVLDPVPTLISNLQSPAPQPFHSAQSPHPVPRHQTSHSPSTFDHANSN